MSHRISRFIVAALALLVPSGCAQEEIRSGALSYNNALSDFGNEQILLNAVRAAKRYPIYYAGIGDLTAKGQMSGRVAPFFPFTVTKGAHITLPTFRVEPSVDVNSGVSTFAVANFNTKEFQNSVMTDITPEIFSLLIQNDWPRELLFHVMVQKIELPLALMDRIESEWQRECDKPWTAAGEELHHHERTSSLCSLTRQARDDFQRFGCGTWPKRHEGSNVRIFNAGDNRCSRLEYSIMYRQLRTLGMEFVVSKPKDTAKNVKVTKGYEAYGGEKLDIYKEEFERGKTSSVQIVFGRSRGEGKQVLFSTKPSRSGREGKFDLRSAHRMIQFLGELINAQLHIPEPFEPKIAIGRHREYVEVPLFQVRDDPAGLLNAAVRVEHEGRRYYIPRPNYGSPDEARSLQVLDLIQQVIAIQTNRADLPKSSTVNLVTTN